MPGNEDVKIAHDETERRRLLRNNLGASAFIFILLELLRPYFFLTDDNVDGMLPLFCQIGSHLLHGQSPFYSDHTFGGGYSFLRDASCIMWHPVYLFVSLLEGTPLKWAIVDIDALFFFLLATAGFVNLAWYLRREMKLSLTDGWLMFFTLSFTYSMASMTTGACWLPFIANHAALPWLALGILQKKWWPGVGLVFLFTLDELLGGHPSPTLSTGIFLTMFAAGLSLSRRSWLPLGIWATGSALAMVVMLPLLIPAAEGFLSSVRVQAGTMQDLRDGHIPILLFPVSLFLGMALSIAQPAGIYFQTYTLALAACAAAWLLLPAIFNRARWQPIQVISLLMMGFIAVLVCRPLVLAHGMAHLPVLRSMRLPLRELLQFQFFLHLFLLTRPNRLALRPLIIITSCSVAALVLPFIFYRPLPTLNAMNWDRRLITSGDFDLYWAKVRERLKTSDRIVPMIPMELHTADRFNIPYSLCGTYDYATLAGVVNASGYSPTAPHDQLYLKTIPHHYFGAYTPDQEADLLAERPDLKFITIESVRPLKITLTDITGAVVDLTPFIPARALVPPDDIRK